TKDQEYTHASTSGDLWNIPHDKLEEFYSLCTTKMKIIEYSDSKLPVSFNIIFLDENELVMRNILAIESIARTLMEIMTEMFGKKLYAYIIIKYTNTSFCIHFSDTI